MNKLQIVQKSPFGDGDVTTISDFLASPEEFVVKYPRQAITYTNELTASRKLVQDLRQTSKTIRKQSEIALYVGPLLFALGMCVIL